jgi:hypothetical protein
MLALKHSYNEKQECARRKFFKVVLSFLLSRIKLYIGEELTVNLDARTVGTILNSCLKFSSVSDIDSVHFTVMFKHVTAVNSLSLHRRYSSEWAVASFNSVLLLIRDNNEEAVQTAVTRNLELINEETEGMVFGFRKRATAVLKPDRQIDNEECTYCDCSCSVCNFWNCFL